jgi:hypothetical protein
VVSPTRERWVRGFRDNTASSNSDMEEIVDTVP